MAAIFTMPRLGQSMEEGTILQWFKSEGDTVRAGEPLMEVMSDKANIEVEAPSDGVLRKILAGADDTVPVNEPIAIIGTADEPIDDLLAGAGSSNGASPAPVAAAPTPVTAPTATSTAAPAGAVVLPTSVADLGAVSPRARRLADQHGVSLSALAGRGTGPKGRILERDVLGLVAGQSVPADAQRSRVTPLAARIADDLGVDPASLALGLPGSRVRAEDVRRVSTPAEAPTPVVPGELTIAQTIPMKGLRKLIADNVAKARSTAPHVTLVAEVDASEALALVAKIAPEALKAYDAKLTLTHLIIKACAMALPDHPLCNAALVGDEIRVYGDFNVGCAVATDNGLLAPVIKSANTKSLGQIAVELKELAGRCRNGKQTKDDLTGGTFTISNLGGYGIDHFDPIINGGQACILGVGRTVEKPAVVDGQIVPRPLMNLCLSFDHRVLDGAPAAQFLQRLRQLIEKPYALFV
jgi:pyruvate dehydrogenase E2 component (dihydrolipoamide acetyltransferase)